MIDAIYINADSGAYIGLAYTPSKPERGDLVDLGGTRWRVKDIVHAPQFPVNGELPVGSSPHVHLTFVRNL